MSDSKPHNHGSVVDRDAEPTRETPRCPDQHSKMTLNLTLEDPTQPNAECVRYKPKLHHANHRNALTRTTHVLQGELPAVLEHSVVSTPPTVSTCRRGAWTLKPRPIH